MPDRENVIKDLAECIEHIRKNKFDKIPCWGNCQSAMMDAIALLKELDELLRKLQNDKDKLCLEVSEWKHKFHDAPPKFVSQGVVDQIRWERDTALSQLEQIGKGLGSKMDDIVALLKEQEEVEPKTGHWIWLQNCANEGVYCSECHTKMFDRYPMKKKLSQFCGHCGAKMDDEVEGR